MQQLHGIIEGEARGIISTFSPLTDTIFIRGENSMATQTIPKICSVEGCGNPHTCKGYCEKHYSRFQRNGDTIRRVPERPPICQIPDCGQKHASKGYCQRHGTRLRKYGDPLATMIRPAEERFWSKVKKTETCWLWMGNRQHRGHGIISINGKTVKAHRYSFFLAHGKWPDNWALHKCNNPPCVNPDHLYDGTPQDNVDDKMRAGNHVSCKGEANKRSKLKDADVIKIRELLEAGNTQQSIANEFHVNQRVIWAIHNKRMWTHVK